MNVDHDVAIARIAALQHGVFTLEQAAGQGVTDDRRTRRLQNGRWLQVFPRVYRLVGAPVTWESRLLAACLAGRPTGRASHRSGAKLWGLPGGSSAFVEITCRRWRRARDSGLVVHESLAYEQLRGEIRSAIPVFSVEVTLLQLGAVVPEFVVEQALDVAVNRSLTTVSSVRSTLEQFATRGRDGCATLRTILDRRAPVIGTPESPAETLLLRRIHEKGLPTPVLQYEVFDGPIFVARVDAAYPASRIALEYESYEHHTGRAALIRDSARRNVLIRLGWTVVTVTAEDLRTGAHAVAATLRELLRRPT